jgi:hypothetical protein
MDIYFKSNTLKYMLFNKFFEIINDFSEVDSDNFNNAEITCIEDLDLGYSILYKLDDIRLEEDSYASEIEEVLDAYDITSYKIEDGFLTFSIN